jgi:hypothetical protein
MPRLYRWAIHITHKLIGSVKATDEQSAIEAAIKKFRIKNPEQQKLLRAQESGKVYRGSPAAGKS